MANFLRVKPLGWALFDLLASALMNQLDTDHAKSVNGDDGSVHDGDVTLGSLTTHRAVHAQTDVLADGDVTATSALKGVVAMAEKVQPRTISSFAIDTNGGASTVALDLTSFDTFLVVLHDSGGATDTATLHTITFTTATGDADREVKKGARFSITVKADPGQTGGAGLDLGAFPASVKGLVASDELGCRFDANDSTTYILKQVGTPGAPSFLCVSATHGGA